MSVQKEFQVRTQDQPGTVVHGVTRKLDTYGWIWMDMDSSKSLVLTANHVLVLSHQCYSPHLQNSWL